MVVLLILVSLLQPSFTGAANRYCDAVIYNPRTHRCCAGKLDLMPYGSAACCGSQAYNRDNYMCCSGHVAPRPNSTSVGCCDKHGYDKNTEICCRSSGVVFETAGIVQPGCCEGQLLDRSKQMCCEGVISARPQSKNVACCKYQPYDRNTHACANGHIASIEPECLGACYNVETELCCKGVIYAKYSELLKCCGNETYIPYNFNREFGICCADNVYRDINAYGECCGRILYDPWDALCCDGNYFPSVPPLYVDKCCGSTGYNEREMVCCNDGFPVFKYYGECCGGKSFIFKHFPRETYYFTTRLEYCCNETIYDPVRTLCCAGNVFTLNEDYQMCCGRAAYNPSKQLCCNTTLISIPPSLTHITDCCGELPYDKNVFVCCGNLLYFKGNTEVLYSCCGSAPYRSDTHICCQGHIYRTKENYSCCGSEYYNISITTKKCCLGKMYSSTTHICCKNQIGVLKGANTSCCGQHSYDGNAEGCCGKKPYRLSHDACCGNSVYMLPPNNHSCCGQKVYDSRVEMCCKDVVNPLKKSCCGYRSFNDDNETCCDGNVYPDPSGKFKCCHSSAYVPNEYYICCEDNTAEHYWRWPKRLYNAKDFTCNCSSQVHPRTTENIQCCDGVPYNADTAVCWGYNAGAGFFSQIFSGTCHDLYIDDGIFRKMYNTSEYLCCDNVLIPRVQGEECCGKGTYVAESQICCDKQIYPRTSATLDCCGNVPLEPLTEICCALEINYYLKYYKKHTKTSHSVGCCGTELYESDTDLCCGKVLYRNVSSVMQCCKDWKSETAMHNPNTEICCLGKVHPKLSPKTSCCEGEAYEKGSDQCCHGSVAKQGFDCCYRWPSELLPSTTTVEIFNVHTQLCCYGYVVDNPTGELKCCEPEQSFQYLNSYFRDTGAVLPVYNSTSHACCHYVPFDPASELCCVTTDEVVRIFSDLHKFLTCCEINGATIRAYNPETESCVPHHGVTSNQLSFITMPN